MKTMIVFVLAAFAELAGCYAVWAWARQGLAAPWLIPGAFALGLFAYILTFAETAAAGRAFAAYCGIYIIVSLGWLWAFEGIRPDRYDVIGAALCLAGAVLIIAAPRAAA